MQSIYYPFTHWEGTPQRWVLTPSPSPSKDSVCISALLDGSGGSGECQSCMGTKTSLQMIRRERVVEVVFLSGSWVLEHATAVSLKLFDSVHQSALKRVPTHSYSTHRCILWVKAGWCSPAETRYAFVFCLKPFLAIFYCIALQYWTGPLDLIVRKRWAYLNSEINIACRNAFFPV